MWTLTFEIRNIYVVSGIGSPSPPRRWRWPSLKGQIQAIMTFGGKKKTAGSRTINPPSLNDPPPPQWFIRVQLRVSIEPEKVSLVMSSLVTPPWFDPLDRRKIPMRGYYDIKIWYIVLRYVEILKLWPGAAFPAHLERHVYEFEGLFEGNAGRTGGGRVHGHQCQWAK